MHHEKASKQKRAKDYLIQKHRIKNFDNFSCIGKQEHLQLRQYLTVPGMAGRRS